MKLAFPVIALATTLLFSDAHAATITVNSTADAGGTCPGATCTLRQAIATAVAGDTINFSLPANTAITLTSGELLINKNLTINGPGANLLTVQRSSAGGTPNFRIFNIPSGNVIANISGLTIANGVTPPNQLGGGISNSGALTLTNVIISGNVAAGTGFSFSYGGGISNGGTLTLINSTVSGNTSNYGGGIYSSGMVTISNSTISGNTVSSNVDSGAGGGIFTQGGTVTLTNSTVSGNTAQGPGGNTDSGGGILTVAGTVALTNSTISGNSGDLGGGIRNVSGGTVRSRNTIIALNTSASGPDVNGPLTSENFNLIGNNSGATIAPAPSPSSDQIGTAGSPINPMLGSLQDNGGPTFTRALLSGSLALEKGHSSGSNTDQRGFARPVDDPGIVNATGGDGSDIGAYEVQPNLLPGCSAINSTVNNNNDAGPDSLRAIIANVCAGSTITFAPTVTGIIYLTSGDLLVNKSLTINGPGANLLSIQRNAPTSGFAIFRIAPASVIVNISGLTIANGFANGAYDSGLAFGGGISNIGALTLTNAVVSNNTAGDGGGGIYNKGGALTLINSTVFGNSAPAAVGGNLGGGIYNRDGALTVTNSTISGNSVSDGGPEQGLYESQGGGIFSGGTTTITNSTISGNTAHGTGYSATGGGIYHYIGTLTITNSTISSNSADLEGGGVYNGSFYNGGTVNLRNTIIAGNTAANTPDVVGRFHSQGYNLIGNRSFDAEFVPENQTGDQIGTPFFPINPLLDPNGLQANGGPTQTIALLVGSPAIDQGHASGSYTDQRDFPRPVDRLNVPNVNGGDGSDIGAFEFGSLPLRILSIMRSGNNIVISFEAVQGKTYRLERKLNMNDTMWQSVNDLTPSANGSAAIPDNGGFSLGTAFYRVRLLL